jgi:hypothetical protein
MNILETLNALNPLKPRYHFDIAVENPGVEDIEIFFRQCERQGFIPKWMDSNTIRVTNCAGLSKVEKSIARLSPEELDHIHGLLIAGGIIATLKNHQAFCRLFDRERLKAKKSKNAKWERIFKSLSKANPVQVELTIQAILSKNSKGDL